MNFSLKNRITLSFIIANLCVLVMGFTVFFYLDSLNKQVEEITTDSNKVSLLTDKIRISAVSILKMQKKIITNKASNDDLEKLNSLCETFQSQLNRLDTFYEEVEVKKIIAKMLVYVDSLRTILSKVSLMDRDNVGFSSIGDLADKILEAFSEFQDIQYFNNEERDKRIKAIIDETRRNMLIVLIITFLATILLSLVIPGKISLPFKKINDAIRELQDCNFDVSIYYNQDDEIGELAREINKMIYNFKIFEDLRTDRVLVEKKKFDTLANMLKKYVLVANANGELIYLNNSLYSMLQLETGDVLKRSINDAQIPACIKEVYELALKRRAKLENIEIVINERRRHDHEHEADENSEAATQEDESEELFTGYANVFPIRGKDSSLDYYLMVLSKEVFA